MKHTESENRWNALLRVSRAWRLEWNVDQLLARVGREAVEFLGFERSAVFLLEKRGLQQRAVWPKLNPAETQDFSRISLRTAEQVVTTGRGLYAHGFKAAESSGADAAAPRPETAAFQPVQTVLCVPLTANRGILGALYVDSAQSQHELTQTDQEFLEMLGLQAAAALEHALLYQSAITDPLTGLFSHIHFQREIEQSVRRAARAEQPLSLILLDLDHFKELNDTCGHEVGNECLRQVATLLRAALRTTDVPARFGGDEFELLLPNTSAAAAVQVAAKIRQRICKLEFGSKSRISATLGVSAYPENALDAQALFLRADDTLYLAKDAGRNRVMRCEVHEAAPSPSALRGMAAASSPGLTPVLLNSQAEPEAEAPTAVVNLEGAASSEKVDGHVVLGRLGTGSTGEVLLVRQPDLDREVALKRPLTQHLSPRQMRDFEQEARVTASLHHPGVIPVHTMGRDHDGRRYYTMRPVSGCSFADILESRQSGEALALRNFPLSRLLEILQRVSETLAYAHQRGVAHLDLNPANIIVGDYGEVTVIDWGGGSKAGGSQSRRQRRKPDAGSELTFLVGSPNCIAPEQLPHSQQPVGPHSDVHALGALLYEILTGQPPYWHENTRKTLDALMHGRVVPPEKLVPEAGIEPVLSELCLQALRVNPAERPKAAEFCERLSRYVRREMEWQTTRFGPGGKALCAGEWQGHFFDKARNIPWLLQDGEWVSQAPGDQYLIWNHPVPGPFRFVCEGWVERADNECSLLGHQPINAQGAPKTHFGYLFQFGAEGGSCSKLARHDHDVLAIPDFTPVPKKRYRLELEYQEGWVSCFIDGKRIFAYREMFPFAGRLLGVYAYGPGSHFRPLEVQQQNWGLNIPAVSVADDLYAGEQYAIAMERYREIAARVPHRMEGAEATLKSALCLAKLQREEEARAVLHSLNGSPLEPFALAEEAVLDFAGRPGADHRRGLKLFQELFARFPESQSRFRLLEIVNKIQKLPFDGAAETTGYIADINKLGRDTNAQPVQTQFRCQTRRTSCLLQLGRWREALDDLLEFQKRTSPAQAERFLHFTPLLPAALAADRLELLSPEALEEKYGNLQAKSAHDADLPAVLACVARKGLTARFLGRVNHEAFVHGAHHLWGFGLCRSARLEQKACTQFQFLTQAHLRGEDVFSVGAYALISAGAEDLLRQWCEDLPSRLPCERRGATQQLGKLFLGLYAFYSGNWRDAAREFAALPPLGAAAASREFLLPQVFLTSLQLLEGPSLETRREFCRQQFCGLPLTLGRILAGEEDARLDARWPHPSYQPDLFLLLALWHEAHGRKKEALETAAPALDETLGDFSYQPLLRALLLRVRK